MCTGGWRRTQADTTLGSSVHWQGEYADCFYIVESGEVKIMIKSRVRGFWLACFCVFCPFVYEDVPIALCSSFGVWQYLGSAPFGGLLCSLLQTTAGQLDHAEVELARCVRGQYFGELALVTNQPRAASVYAVGVTKCLGALYLTHCRTMWSGPANYLGPSSATLSHHWLNISQSESRCSYVQLFLPDFM